MINLDNVQVKYLDKPELIPSDEGGWILSSTMMVSIGKFTIIIPMGFKTDLASVPFPFSLVLPKEGKYKYAAVVHDYLYSEINDTGINKTIADMIFEQLMKHDGVGWLTRKAMTRAVQGAGSVFWKPKLSNGGYIDRAMYDCTSEANKYYNFWKDQFGIRR